ncbi:MAG TPA: AraC family transcriptional regulator [Candidatus Fimimorpha faecalis]|uniref:AraC family transcriptional regulator n=1 Tax=Candidatus Fimimorpha faecalis TaxID=2840824 RepID=A0A9D1EGC5_9FIRM|nr:AraC family transcriptional regulator [Candidatus Fimimorpha faecalis]
MTKETNYRVGSTFRWLGSSPIEDTEISLTVCGIERCTPDKYYGPCIRNDFHVHFILSGKGTLRVDNTYYNLHRGQIFLIPPDIETYYYSDPSDPWQYTWVSFTGTKAAFYLEKAGLSASSPIRDCYIKPEEFLAITEKILTYHELTISNELFRTAWLYEILALLVYSQDKKLREDHYPVQYNYSPEVYVNAAVEYIHHNYSNVCVSEIANYIGISRSYLTHIFKQKLQVSPQKYLLTYRLEQASHLLRSTNLSIQEVSEKVGYTNPLTFSKIFKNVYGLSPKNYRLHILDETLEG